MEIGPWPSPCPPALTLLAEAAFPLQGGLPWGGGG